MPAYTFQHIKDGEDIDGETDAAYVIPSVVEADSGSYRVRVTNPTSGRVRTSGPENIVVTPTPVPETLTFDSTLATFDSTAETFDQDE